MFSKFTVGIALAASVAAASLQAADAPSEMDRLVAVGKLWVTVKYFHPSLAYRDIDWDQSLIQALPKIRGAQTSAEYEAAVRSMMQGLDTEPSGPAGSQRVWIHHGLPPEVGEPSTHFYTAFQYRSTATPTTVDIPMGEFSVNVRLSEQATIPIVPRPRPVSLYRESYPATEHRILAAYKIWGAFHYFFAYRDLMDEDWDDLLPHFLPRLIAAKDALEYNLAIAEWLTATTDSQVAVDSETMNGYLGEAAVGLRLRVVEKHALVAEVLDPEAAKAGVKVGDVVKRVDGETLVDRFKRQAVYRSASTPQRLGFDVTKSILNGPNGSKAALTIEDQAGARKELTLERSRRFAAALGSEPAGEAVKTLRGGIGYVDLRRLKRDEVDAMFEKFRESPAIIFDLRGVPADDSVAAIAPRLTTEVDVPADIVTGRVATTPDLQQGSIASPSASYFFLETIGNSKQWKYQGKTAMLVDERTVGAGEQAGLFLMAANKTDIIGTPTAGAHSVFTNFSVPGGIVIRFSGEDIRQSNGGKLQRLGLQPNINVAPTVTGIRTGKDEVLEKALDSLMPKPPAVKQPTRAGVAQQFRVSPQGIAGLVQAGPRPVYTVGMESLF